MCQELIFDRYEYVTSSIRINMLRHFTLIKMIVVHLVGTKRLSDILTAIRNKHIANLTSSAIICNETLFL